MEIFWVLLFFLGLAAVISLAGYTLCIKSDQLADQLGWDQSWMGILLLATITSLPELMTGISSVRIADSPDFAIGDVLGSSIFNLTLVFFLDALMGRLGRKKHLFKYASSSHLLSAGLGVIMVSFIGFSVVFHKPLSRWSIGPLGFPSIVICGIYFVSLYLLYRHEPVPSKDLTPAKTEKRPTQKSISVLSISAALVILAGTALPLVAKQMIEIMHWNEAFIGTLFLAGATSLPELAVTLGAIRIGAPNLALSNLFGSNLFNGLSLAINDAFYTKTSIFQAVDKSHAATALIAVMMTGILIVGLTIKPTKRWIGVATLPSLLVLLCYVVNLFLVYQSS